MSPRLYEFSMVQTWPIKWVNDFKTFHIIPPRHLLIPKECLVRLINSAICLNRHFVFVTVVFELFAPKASCLSESWSFGSTMAAVLHPGKDDGRLFHDQIILYGFDSIDAHYDFTRFIDGLLRISEAAQLNGPLVSFDIDLK